MFIKGTRQFNCKTAHKQKLDDPKMFGYEPGGNVIMVRGSKRILFAHLGWKTVCVDYNGLNLTDKEQDKLLSNLFDAYTDDRFKNP